MPKFTLIKHGEGDDPSVTMEFESDILEVVRENIEDFVRGSGFFLEPHLEERDVFDQFDKSIPGDWVDDRSEFSFTLDK